MKQKFAEKVIILARVSTIEQNKGGRLSTPAQLRTLREHFKTGGKFHAFKEVIAEHELIESATKRTKTGNGRKFDAAMKITKTSTKPIAILADVVDRFTRDFEKAVEFDPLIKAGRVELHFVTDELVLHKRSNPQEWKRWYNAINEAKGFALNLSYKVKKSIREAIERGEFRAFAPLGFVNKVIEDRLGNKIKKIEQDWRAPLVKQAFILYSSGKYSFETLAAEMAKRGLTEKTKRRRSEDGVMVRAEEKPISKGALNTILTNSFYYGEFKWWDDIEEERMLVKGTNYEPIITKDLFTKVQAILKLSNSKNTGKTRDGFKFRKMLHCAFCGSTLAPENFANTYKKDSVSEGVKRNYYHCNNGRRVTNPNWYEEKFGRDHSGMRIAQRGKVKGEVIINCPSRWWKEEEVEEEICKWLGDIYVDEGELASLKKEMVENFEQTQIHAEEQIAALRSRVTKLTDLKSDLLKEFASERDPEIKAEFRREFEKVRAEILEHEQEIATLSEAGEVAEDGLLDILSLPGNLLEHYKKLNQEDQIRLLKIVFGEICLRYGEWRLKGGKGKKVKDKSMTIRLNEPFQRLFDLGLMRYYPDDGAPLEDLTKLKREEASLIP